MMLDNKGVQAHIDKVGTHFKPLLVFKESLAKSDPQLLKEVGDGFIAFDERVALVDMSTPDGMRGYVTMNTGEIHRLKRIFEQLRVHGRELNKELVERLHKSQGVVMESFLYCHPFHHNYKST